MASPIKHYKTVSMLMVLINLQFLLLPSLTLVQSGEKAVMIVQNYRNGTITMNFSYFIGDYSWSIMERDIPIDGDLTYKIPTSLPGSVVSI